MSKNAVFDDASIPVLTEVVDDTPPAAPEPGAPPAAQHEWELLERRIAERILEQLQGRVDFVLEQRLRDSMAEVLQHALAGLTEEIRAGLQQTLETVVAGAVAQELAQLRTLES